MVRTSPPRPDDLAARCRTGDEQAWAELVDRASRIVYAVATREFRLGTADAEDVFQETFARAYERLDTLRDDARVVAWVVCIARRLCVDRLRRSRREVLWEEPPHRHDEAAGVERVHAAVDVELALATLSPDMADVVERFFLRDQSYREIATDLDLPAGTVASRLSRALDRLAASHGALAA